MNILTEQCYNSPVMLRALLRERGMNVQKKFGQNFLINPALRKKLIDALEIEPGCLVWEIGPGLGAQTRLLLDSGARVSAFELDKGFCGLLNEMFSPVYPGRWNLIEGDVMRTWKAAAKALAAENKALAAGAAALPSPPLMPLLFGNLPYNIAGALLGNFIENRMFFRRCVITAQKEVAERLTAPRGSARYSSLSVLCQAVYTARPVAALAPAAFYPKPNVDSLCVRLDLKPGLASPENAAALTPVFFRAVRALFAMRRKTVKNNLEALYPPEKTAAALNAAGIDPSLRAENLRPEDFIAIAKNLTGE